MVSTAASHARWPQVLFPGEAGVEKGWMDLREVNLRAASLEFVCSVFPPDGAAERRVEQGNDFCVERAVS